MIRAEIADENGDVGRLTADECTRFALLLYSAGTETVAKLLGCTGCLVLVATLPWRAVVAGLAVSLRSKK